MTILVTGATGNIGRLVVDALLAAGATDVRALTVDPVRAALPASVEAFRGYVGRPASIGPALEGVHALYLAPTPHTAGEVVGLAREAGVERIVDLSGEEGSWWYAVAEAVEASGAEWTHLMPGDFMGNISVWADTIRETGTVRDAAFGSASAPIALEDVAAVAATALLHDGHAGRAYSLTGPETITRERQARLIGEALGRELRLVELTREEAIAELHDLGEYAEWFVDGLLELVDTPAEATSTVEEVLGRPGTPFSTWVRDNVEMFR
ncbi:NAD(P)H-binding protein [Actinoalloteichus caeruleus]|uniref:NAD(P)H-binding protein n=1 Tax=Actinoalloteichus cyanogriseus TaxID=2893586 RepID=UPI003AADD7BB